MSLDHQGKVAARDFRDKHNLGNHPISDLVFTIEQATGTEVAVLNVEDANEHGLTMWDPTRKVAFIGVARTRHPMRQRSTLAHELAHLVFEDWSHEDLTVNRPDLFERASEEIRADSFARHLLIPQEGLRDEFGSPGAQLTETELSHVVQWFGVSPAIAAIALCDGGYISSATKDTWMTLKTPALSTRFGWSDKYRTLQFDADQTRTPQRLLARAISGYQQGIVSARMIATLRGLPEADVVAELADSGIFPTPPDPSWMDPEDLLHIDVDVDEIDAALGNLPSESNGG